MAPEPPPFRSAIPRRAGPLDYAPRSGLSALDANNFRAPDAAPGALTGRETRSGIGVAKASGSPKIASSECTGTARYTDKEILAASGLQLGQNAADGDFKEAARLLGDSGLFSEVQYSYSFSSAGTKLELQLADTDKSKLVPARFDNFVWFTDDELRAALESRVLQPPRGEAQDREHRHRGPEVRVDLRTATAHAPGFNSDGGKRRVRS